MAISSRSAKETKRPDSSARLTVRMPPPCRNQRFPTANERPAAAAASSLDNPRAISSPRGIGNHDQQDVCVALDTPDDN